MLLRPGQTTLPRVLFASASQRTPLPTTLDFAAASARLADTVTTTPLHLSRSPSKRCEVWLKREDLQVVRSYKLRGAYNLVCGLSAAERARGVVAASAGNYAQGLAYACRLLGLQGVIFMPKVTPRQKISQTKMWGEENVEVRLVGDTFDDVAAEARAFCDAEGRTFVPPFDD